MPKVNLESENTRLSAAAVKLAGLHGWENVALDKVSKLAKIPLSTIKNRISTPLDLVPIIAQEVDKKAFASLGKLSGSAHDILFEILMARFDNLQNNRRAFLSMADAAFKNKKLSYALTRATFSSIERIIDLSSLKVSPRPVLILGILLVHTWTFFVWRKDLTSDMAKTMAALDRSLRLLFKSVHFFPLKLPTVKPTPSQRRKRNQI